MRHFRQVSRTSRDSSSRETIRQYPILPSLSFPRVRHVTLACLFQSIFERNETVADSDEAGPRGLFIDREH